MPEMLAFQPSVTISADKFPLKLTSVGQFNPCPGVRLLQERISSAMVPR